MSQRPVNLLSAVGLKWPYKGYISWIELGECIKARWLSLTLT
jgi:hypothetical protein